MHPTHRPTTSAVRAATSETLEAAAFVLGLGRRAAKRARRGSEILSFTCSAKAILARKQGQSKNLWANLDSVVVSTLDMPEEGPN